MADEILGRIAEGQKLRQIAEQEGMPAVSTITLWAADDRDGFSARYNRARRAWTYALGDEILDIADDSSGDTIDTEAGTRLNTEFVQRSKLRVETRRWLMSKFAPDVFGDKQTIESTGPHGGPIQNEHTVIRRVIIDPKP